MTKWIRIAVLAALGMGTIAYAQVPTERKVFTLPQYTTVGGETIRDVQIAYESYGQLNAAGDNAIFTAHSRDSAIGPGKPFDTDRYFVLVLSADAFVDVGPLDFVHLQKALAGSLGIRRFAAIAVVDVRAAYDRDFDFD